MRVAPDNTSSTETNIPDDMPSPTGAAPLLNLADLKAISFQPDAYQPESGSFKGKFHLFSIMGVNGEYIHHLYFCPAALSIFGPVFLIAKIESHQHSYDHAFNPLPVQLDEDQVEAKNDKAITLSDIAHDSNAWQEIQPFELSYNNVTYTSLYLALMQNQVVLYASNLRNNSYDPRTNQLTYPFPLAILTEEKGELVRKPFNLSDFYSFSENHRTAIICISALLALIATTLVLTLPLSTSAAIILGSMAGIAIGFLITHIGLRCSMEKRFIKLLNRDTFAYKMFLFQTHCSAISCALLLVWFLAPLTVMASQVIAMAAVVIIALGVLSALFMLALEIYRKGFGLSNRWINDYEPRQEAKKALYNKIATRLFSILEPRTDVRQIFKDQFKERYCEDKSADQNHERKSSPEQKSSRLISKFHLFSGAKPSQDELLTIKAFYEIMDLVENYFPTTAYKTSREWSNFKKAHPIIQGELLTELEKYFDEADRIYRGEANGGPNLTSDTTSSSCIPCCC